MKNLILDVHNVAWRSYYAKAYSWMKGSRGFSGHIYGSMKQIFKMIKLCEGEKFEIVFAYDKYPKRKLKIDPAYKGHREKPKFNPIPDVKTLFNMIPSTIIYTDDEECDDTIASYVVNNKDNINIINSNDKDLWQLLNNHYVNILIHQNFILEEDILKKFNLPIDQCYKIPLHKAIYGDSSDRIPNLQTRFQWKIIEPVFKACNGSSEDFLNKAKEILQEKHYNKLAQKEERFKINYQLANLKKDLNYVTIDNEGDRDRLENFLNRWGCRSIIKDLDLLFP